MAMRTATEEQSIGDDQRAKVQKSAFSPWMWVLAGGAATLAGLALNWNWLMAAGLAPIILGILPCAVMCSLGVCAHRFIGRANTTL